MSNLKPAAPVPVCDSAPEEASAQHPTRKECHFWMKPEGKKKLKNVERNNAQPYTKWLRNILATALSLTTLNWSDDSNENWHTSEESPPGT